MDFDKCNLKKINQFKVEGQRWEKGKDAAAPEPSKKGQRSQPAKRKRKKK